MSRKLLTLVLASCLVLSFGQIASGQNAEVQVIITGGSAPTFPDDINNLNAKVGNAATYNYAAQVRSTVIAGASSLGLMVYSPDGSLNPSGATVSNVALSADWLSKTKWWTFGGGKLNTTMLDGSLPEQFLFGGIADVSVVGDGFEEPNFVTGVTWDVTFSGDGVLCVDSAFFPPATDWLMTDTTSAGNSLGPDFVNGSGDQGVGGQSPTAFCVTTFLIPDLPPTLTCPSAANGSHCDPVVMQTSAVDPDPENQPISYSATTTGAGTVSVDANGQVTYLPDAADVNGAITVTVTASEPDGPSSSCDIDVTITNVAPTLTCPPDLAVAKGSSSTSPASNGVDPDACDNLVYSFAGVTPTPGGQITVDAGTGAVTFDALEGDAAGADTPYDITVEVTDGIATAQCTFTFTVLFTEPFCVRVEQTDLTNAPGSIQGAHELVDLVFDGGSNEVGGFDFLLQYDNSALSLASVAEGSIYASYEWEYFTFRFGPNGNCSGGCPSGKVRVTGLADQNDGSHRPLSTALAAGDTFATLDFLVSNDRNLGCQFAPIRWCWFDCGDNSLSSPGGDTLYISRNVFDYSGTDKEDLINDQRANISGSDQSFPTQTGAPDACDVSGGPGKPSPVRFVDYKNGGIKIICPDAIDGRGDVNLNGISNEIADAVIFTQYFVRGLVAFSGVGIDGATAASEVNGDGIPLTVADLVYLIRVIVGDALPLPKLAHNVNSMNITSRDGVVSTDTELGAALFVFEGSAAVELIATNMKMEVGMVDGNTHALVFDIGSESIAAGEVLSASSELISAEAADYFGNALNSLTKIVPTTFAVHQNYPNPFNPSTKIGFDLPSASEYSVTIYNVAGQKVHTITGQSDAGLVEVEWNALNEASGIYFYTVKAGASSTTLKMVLLK